MQLAELEALYEKATKGEWRSDDIGVYGTTAVSLPPPTDPSRRWERICYFGSNAQPPTRPAHERNKLHAEMIVALHNSFPALVARLRAAERELKWAHMTLWPFAHGAEFVPADRNARIVDIPSGRHQVLAQHFIDAKKAYDRIAALPDEGVAGE